MQIINNVDRVDFDNIDTEIKNIEQQINDLNKAKSAYIANSIFVDREKLLSIEATMEVTGYYWQCLNEIKRLQNELKKHGTKKRSK